MLTYVLMKYAEGVATVCDRTHDHYTAMAWVERDPSYYVMMETKNRRNKNVSRN